MEKFFKAPASILCAAGYYHANGYTALTPADKLVYIYMLDRYVFFSEKLDKAHFESQETIAKALKLTRPTVNKILKKFRDTGVLEARDKERGRGIEYTKLHPLQLTPAMGTPEWE